MATSETTNAGTNDELVIEDVIGGHTIVSLVDDGYDVWMCTSCGLTALEGNVEGFQNETCNPDLEENPYLHTEWKESL